MELDREAIHSTRYDAGKFVEADFCTLSVALSDRGEDSFVNVDDADSGVEVPD